MASNVVMCKPFTCGQFVNPKIFHGMEWSTEMQIEETINLKANTDLIFMSKILCLAIIHSNNKMQ